MAELHIIEQPSSAFRYRYKSELNGAHGHISGENTLRSNKTLPKVTLLNYPYQKAYIRCTLAAADADREHPHQLVKKSKNGTVRYENFLAILLIFIFTGS